MTYPQHVPAQPPTRRASAGVGPGAAEPGALRALRAVTYLLTSLASLVFLIVVLWATVKVNQIQTVWEDSPLGQLSSLSSTPSSPTTGGLEQFCLQFPNAQGC